MCLTGIAYSICILLYILYIKTQFLNDIKKINLFTLILIFISVFIGLFLSNILYFYLLKHNEPSVVIAITFSAPLFTLLGAYLILQEKMHIYGILGVLSIVLGIILISLNIIPILYGNYFT